MSKVKSDGKVNFISDMGEVTITSENFLTQRKANETWSSEKSTFMIDNQFLNIILDAVHS